MKTQTALLFLAIVQTVAHAAPIPGLFNTGVDDDGNLLAGSGAVDPHYTLIVSADAGLPGPDAVTLNPGFPVGPWLAEGPDSRWIAPQANQGNGAPGEYRYRISFDLTGFDETTANISGEWGVDNDGTDILLNGASTGNFNGNGFAGLTPFSITSGFIAGVNTLDFVVTNAGAAAGPTGLRVEMTGTVLVPGEPPSILDSPESQSVFEDEPFSLSVVADGAPTLSYQWQLDGVDIPGATSTTYDVLEATSADAGDYTVIVTNSFGTATSDPPATITVVEEVPGLFNTGVDETGAVIADGEIDPHYQIAVNPDSESPDAIVHDSSVFPIVAGPWLANNDVSKWISPAFTTVASAGGDYTYRLTFDLAGFDPSTAFVEGNWTSDNAGLAILINGSPTGNTNPGSFGALTPFTIPPGNFISGLNTIEFVLNNAAVGYTGLRVEGIRAGAAPGSGGGGPPVLLRQPEDQLVEIGSQANFSVLADGAQPLSYQWRFNGADLGGATGPELTIFSVSEASAGDYDVVVTNGEGEVTSDTASLTILRRPPEILTQPADQFSAPGESATFAVVADGTMPLNYQWRRGGTEIPGATSSEYTIDPVSEADAGEYDVVITNTDGTLTSDTATLTVLDRVPGIFRSGVDDNGIPLLDNEVDPHYTLIANANGPETEALAMGAIPSPPWIPNSATSRWIGPTTDSNGAPGLYTFRTTFDLLGFDPETVILVGSWSSDNAAPEIRLNGVATGLSHPGNFDTLFDFMIDDGFVDGTNTLEFDVMNAGDAANPIGLRLENLSALGTAVEVPLFQITSITLDADPPTSVSFTWNSRPDENYCVEFSRDLKTWLNLDDGYMSQGDTTTFTDTFGVGTGGRVYYRVGLAE